MSNKQLEMNLPEVMQSLREEITFGMIKAGDESLKFKLNAIELEFQVTFSRGDDEKVKVSLWGIGAEKMYKNQEITMHKVKLSLSPPSEKEMKDILLQGDSYKR